MGSNSRRIVVAFHLAAVRLSRGQADSYSASRLFYRLSMLLSMLSSSSLISTIFNFLAGLFFFCISKIGQKYEKPVM